MPNKIHIPSYFRLNGKKIIVEFDDEYCDENKLFGEADFTEKKIILTKRDKGKSLNKRHIDQTFYHELVHMILDAANKHQLKYNEDFVDSVGLLLYEFERTKGG